MLFSHDGANQLLLAIDSFSNLQFQYDLLGRVTKETWANPGAPTVELNSAFDANGNRTQLSVRINHGSGFVNDLKNVYTFDGLNRMTRVDQTANGGNAVAEKRADFAYNAASQFASIARYKDTDGLTTDLVASSAFSYDGIGRLTGLAHTRSSTTFANYTWAFDAASRVTSMNFTSLVGPNGTTSYSYDNTRQLTAADHSFQADENYSFDTNGNRTSTGYSTGTNNRLTSDGTFNYTYDAEGNRLTRTRISSAQADDYLTEYAWDHHNRLTGVTFKNNQGTVTKSTAYEYDVFGRRVEATLDADGAGPAVPIVARWVYDGSDLLLVFNGAGELYHRYLFGPGVEQVLADEQYAAPSQTPSSAGTTFWGMPDNQGTIRDVVFAGYRFDKEAQCHAVRHRDFHATIGRWVHRDPANTTFARANQYAYVSGRPTVATDPFGLSECNCPSTQCKCLKPINELLNSKINWEMWYARLGVGLAKDVQYSMEHTFWDRVAKGDKNNKFTRIEEWIRAHVLVGVPWNRPV